MEVIPVNGPPSGVTCVLGTVGLPKTTAETIPSVKAVSDLTPCDSYDPVIPRYFPRLAYEV